MRDQGGANRKIRPGNHNAVIITVRSSKQSYYRIIIPVIKHRYDQRKRFESTEETQGARVRRGWSQLHIII